MKYTLTLLSLAIIFIMGCKKKDSAPPTVPTLTTTAITNISGPTAQSGGVITDNGGATITASGICWSKTNNSPTISDDTARSSITSGSFTSLLKKLDPSANYYVRAYAINSAGTGYGNMVTFNTGNGVPQARNIDFVGTAAVTNKIKVTYTYYDFENDPQATAGYQWYIATDTTVGAMGTAISGAMDSIYAIAAGDQNKFLRVAITPKSSAGTSPGAVTNSKWIGPVVAEPTTVSFTYNGQTVTYGIIISATTQKRWLDRNIGATRAATSATDYLAYGDLFQWGRPADGHQLMNWTSATTGAPVNGTTTILAPTDNPGNNLFIVLDANGRWRSDATSLRWEANPQGPCPFGWHVPSRTEWTNENLVNGSTAFTKIKIVLAGQRRRADGNLEPGLSGAFGEYWQSTRSGTNVGFTEIESVVGIFYTSTEALGNSVRCIKD